MEKIKQVEFELESVCPLLMDKWNDESKAKTDDEYREEAMQKIFRDEKGNISIEAKAVEAVIKAGSSEIGKKMAAKKNRQMVSAGVFIKPLFLNIGKKEPDCIKKDIVTRKGQGDKVTRVPTYRPMFNEWTVKGKIDLIGVEPSFVRQALEVGGLKYGLYGYRPKFGRFIVRKFIEVNTK